MTEARDELIIKAELVEAVILEFIKDFSATPNGTLDTYDKRTRRRFVEISALAVFLKEVRKGHFCEGFLMKALDNLQGMHFAFHLTEEIVKDIKKNGVEGDDDDDDDILNAGCIG